MAKTSGDTKVIKTEKHKTTLKTPRETKRTKKEPIKKIQQESKQPESKKKVKRHFKVYYNGELLTTRPSGSQPKQAARKAVSAIIKQIIINLKEKSNDSDYEPKETEYINKPFRFYLVDCSRSRKKNKNNETPRNFYEGIRKPVNPDINFYLTKGGNKITEDEYNGKFERDKNGNVIATLIPHVYTKKNEKGEEIKETKYISYKYVNDVKKLTQKYFKEHPEEIITTDNSTKKTQNKKTVKVKSNKKKEANKKVKGSLNKSKKTNKSDKSTKPVKSTKPRKSTKKKPDITEDIKEVSEEEKSEEEKSGEEKNEEEINKREAKNNIKLKRTYKKK